MSENSMNINWYPGHMTKAKRMMQENIRLIDLVIELLDARIPFSSRNPDIDELGKNKARLIILNKSDMADEAATDRWESFFQEKGMQTLKADSRKSSHLKSIQSRVREACKEKIERDRRKGIINRPVRAMVVGIPNVGKSTFINTLAGKACAKTGNKPGVTKGKQWIRLNKQIELLDTPGVLWPKFEDQDVARRLAYIGAIRDEVLNTEELAAGVLTFLSEHYANVLGERYHLKETQDGYRMLAGIAEERKCLKKGGEADTLKASALILEEFRNGKLGRFTLEYPEEL